MYTRVYRVKLVLRAPTTSSTLSNASVDLMRKQLSYLKFVLSASLVDDRRIAVYKMSHLRNTRPRDPSWILPSIDMKFFALTYYAIIAALLAVVGNASPTPAAEGEGTTPATFLTCNAELDHWLRSSRRVARLPTHSLHVEHWTPPSCTATSTIITAVRGTVMCAQAAGRVSTFHQTLLAYSLRTP
ncbi:unnamed protein product [Cyclocybe aegerita]|uniref:Uncharacterized protein n=1 Tax=Cyclocybe aegerita TaxID=1973307 RepID=A0A8S0VQV9_CYCAE|nr:unnamed protein product [Cyclocybe aegerita]